MLFVAPWLHIHINISACLVWYLSMLWTRLWGMSTFVRAWDWGEPERMPKSGLFGVRLVKSMPSIANVFFFEVSTPNGWRSAVHRTNKCCSLHLSYTSNQHFSHFCMPHSALRYLCGEFNDPATIPEFGGECCLILTFGLGLGGGGFMCIARSVAALLSINSDGDIGFGSMLRQSYTILSILNQHKQTRKQAKLSLKTYFFWRVVFVAWTRVTIWTA